MMITFREFVEPINGIFCVTTSVGRKMTLREAPDRGTALRMCLDDTGHSHANFSWSYAIEIRDAKLIWSASYQLDLTTLDTHTSTQDDDIINIIMMSLFNHFVRVDPHWFTQPVTILAYNMYRTRTYEEMPIFADAIEEAGASDPFLLTALRNGEAAAVRWLWAVYKNKGQNIRGSGVFQVSQGNS